MQSICKIRYYSAIKNELSFARKWIELEMMMLSKVSQTPKDNHSVSSHTWNLYLKRHEAGMVAHTFNPQHLEGRGVDVCESEASLVYR